MNSPMRFAGETFYQSGYSEAGRKLTTLSVVENSGWMLPYVSCMIVAVGMLAQFGIVLLRFLSRQQKPGDELKAPADARSKIAAPKSEREEPATRKQKGKAAFSAPPPMAHEEKSSFRSRYGIAIAVLLLVSLFEANLIRPPKPDDRGMDLAAFGRLPVGYESRVKPLDALARNSLVDLLNKQSFKFDYADRKAKSNSAVRWLLDVAVGKRETEDYQVFRIDNEDLVKALGLTPVPNMSYSWKQILEKTRPAASSPTGEELPELLVQAGQAREKADANKKLDASEREVVKLYQRMMLYKAIEAAFDDAGSRIQNKKDPAGEDPSIAWSSLLLELLQVTKKSAELEQTAKQPPMAVPLKDGSWITVVDASLLRYFNTSDHATDIAAVERQLGAMPDRWKLLLNDLDLQTRQARGNTAELAEIESKRRQIRSMQTATGKLAKLFALRNDPQKQLGPAGEKFLDILDAYRKGDAPAFNADVAAYRELIQQNPPNEYDLKRRDWEAFLLRSEPFFWNTAMYLIAFCFAAAAWLGYRKPLNRISFWIVAATFVVHTAALILRIYVTERPPVTNLYSSAVFIGWAAVLLGLILEAVYKNGFGNVVSSLAGLGSLLIAWLLSRQGDTIESLEAVLDTTFWLATHVTCITLGYATTYIAGLLGMVYVIRGVATPSLTQGEGKELARMTYCTLCFAIFFSFVGTVLGGLWADDSWGRFWGWDPKENGALIIVLWNALVLHARWDGLVKDRGLAVLAVFGNITTSWSYFGVNQLGVGLHNYGFNQQLMDVMTGFVISSLCVACLGMLPKDAWWSGSKLRGAE
ncbi:MAG: cytochrome c biogenesis protein CcsA [Planctomycetia bacterium]|nr:cytochrome c biogenesis protein CcsA [Planctomycetia bacterium]